MKHLLAVLFLAGCADGTTPPADATLDRTVEDSADVPAVDVYAGDATADHAEVSDVSAPFDASVVADATSLLDVSTDARADAAMDTLPGADASSDAFNSADAHD